MHLLPHHRSITSPYIPPQTSDEDKIIFSSACPSSQDPTPNEKFTSFPICSTPEPSCKGPGPPWTFLQWRRTRWSCRPVFGGILLWMEFFVKCDFVGVLYSKEYTFVRWLKCSQMVEIIFPEIVQQAERNFTKIIIPNQNHHPEKKQKQI